MNDDEAAAIRISYPYDSFLGNRITVVSSLFAADAYSIDAIIIAGTVLTALGFRRYGGRGPGADQRNFERLLLDYWPSYVDRVSILEVMRFLESREEARRDQSLIDAIRRSFVTDLPYGQIRSVADDPSREEWNEFLHLNSASFNESGWYSYARVMFRDFRNSVQHRLDIAKGKEARRLGIDSPFFYVNHGGAVRFGFDHPRLAEVLRDVVAGLRAWAVAGRHDIFAG